MRITAIISQNRNAYEEGLGPGFERLRKVWAEPTEPNGNTLRASLTPAANQRRYFTGVSEADKSLIAPEGFTLDDRLLARPGGEFCEGGPGALPHRGGLPSRT